MEVSSNKLKVSLDVVERTHRVIRLALELDEYWRKNAPLYELSDEDVVKILGLLTQIEELVSQLKRGLSSRP